MRYTKKLTRFNISLRIKSKQLFEHYLEIQDLQENKHYIFSVQKDGPLLRGQFARFKNLGEWVFKPETEEGEKLPSLEFVDMIAKRLNLTYLGALNQINEDFNLGLIETEDTCFKSYSEDSQYAVQNGIFAKSYDPQKGLPEDNKEALLFLNGTELLGAGGISMFIGQPSAGKSNLSETICTKFNNPSIDGLGFDFKVPAESTILYIDMERSDRLLHRGWERLTHRSKQNNPNPKAKAIFLGYKGIANRQSSENRINKLERDVLIHKPSILIIDGIAKMIEDMNNLNECTEFTRWLSNFAEERKLGVIATIHANPSDLKAQGHLGSVLLRECESVLALKYDKTKGNTQRILTTEFQHGKVRGDKDKVETCFEWDNEQNCFVSAEKKIAPDKNSADEVKKNIQKAFVGKEFLSYKQLADALSKLTGNSYETERKKIGRYVQQEFVVLNNSFYYLHPSVKNV